MSNIELKSPAEIDVTVREEKLLRLISDLDQFSRQKRFFSGLNIFEAAGLQRQEIKHSNFLAFLLRPQETHGLRDTFLKRLIQKALDNLSVKPPFSPLTFALSDFSDALVSREWRDIDLVVESKDNQFVFAIENKIDASESQHQLLKYEGIIHSSFSKENKLFAYLTKDGEPPSNERWSAISYSDVMDALQEAVSHHSVNLTSEAKIVIDQYVRMIRRNIVPDQELVDQCRRLYAQHKDALDLIYRYGEVDAFESAANLFFKNHSDLKPSVVRSGRAAFLPIPLVQAVPEFEGTNWFGQSRPVILWFYLGADYKFGLVIEVGPFVSEQFPRELLVQRLLDYFKSSNKIYPKYTRVYSEYKKLTEDQVSNSEEIEKVMDAFYSTVTSKHLPAVIEIVKSFFQK